MPVSYNPTPIDFSALANLGQIPERLRMRDLRSQFASGAFNGPNGELDYGKMIAAVGGVNPSQGAKMATDQMETKSLTDYRNAQIAADAQSAANPKPTAAQLKYKYQAEDDLAQYGGTIANLDEAERLINEGIYEGGLAPMQAELGANWNYGGVMDAASKATGGKIIDPATARRTQQYQNIMGPEAMKMMSQQLKGSTAYQELLRYQEMFANPKLPKETKAKQLARLKNAIMLDVKNKQNRVEELSGAGGTVGDTPELSPGVEVDGYTYKGGDPNDPASWEAQ